MSRIVLRKHSNFNASEHIFRIEAGNVNACDALDPAEEGVGIHLADEETLLPEEEIDAAVIES